MKRTTIHLDEDCLKHLKKRAKVNHVKIAHYIRLLIWADMDDEQEMMVGLTVKKTKKK